MDNFDNTNSEITPSNIEGESAMAMPIGTSDFTDEPGLDPLAGAESSRRFSTGSLWVLGVIVLAVGGLFSMKFMAAADASGAEVSGSVAKTVDDFLHMLRGDGSATDDAPKLLESADRESLEVLATPYVERQVPLKDLQRDPFLIFETMETESGTTEDPAEIAAALAAQRKQQREDELNEAANDFRVTSIIGGSKPLATINGEIVRIGDQVFAAEVSVPFTVDSIDNSVVTMSAHDEAFDISVTIEVVLDLDS